MDDKDFRNCILLIAGGNLTLSAMHVGAGLAELFVAAISACLGGKRDKRKFVSIQGEEYSYDCSNEA